jgi:hypothetical protein
MLVNQAIAAADLSRRNAASESQLEKINWPEKVI